MQFRREPNEPFWKYFERFKDLLAQCPHHGIKKWRQFKILYDGLDYPTKTLLETMCQGEFLRKDEDQVWNLIEDLAEKTVQWESCSDKSKNENPTTYKIRIHSIEFSIAVEAKNFHLMRRLELLKAKEQSMVKQVNSP